jgi:hypothetical protein
MATQWATGAGTSTVMSESYSEFGGNEALFSVRAPFAAGPLTRARGSGGSRKGSGNTAQRHNNIVIAGQAPLHRPSDRNGNG